MSASGPSVAPPAQTAAPTAPTTPETAPSAPATGSPGGAPAATPFEAAVRPWDAATVDQLRRVFAAGAAAGQRADVFAKLGDSITESASFASDLGHGWMDLASWSRLEPVVRYFSRRAFSNDREDNSFSRGSMSATAGWTTQHMLEGGDNCPLERELAAIRPAFAVLMIGTNDADQLEVADYTRNLGEILDRIARRNVAVLLSTIPEQRSNPRALERGHQINDVIRRTAAARHLPLIDYNLALASLPNAGLSDDNIHPSVFVDQGDSKAGVFTAAALRNGYNVRNLTFLLALERLVAALSLR